MSLNKVYKSFLNCASTLNFRLKDALDGEYKEVNFLELTKNNGAVLKKEPLRYGITRPQLVQLIANMYCDAEESGDELMRDKTISAWLCLYWYRIYEWIASSRSLNLPSEDFVYWLQHCVDACLWYRPWRPKRIDRVLQKKTGKTVWIDNPQYKPEEVNSADKSMNHWISLERARRYQEANKDKRKLNNMTISLSSFEDENGNSALDRNPLLAEPGYTLDPIYEIMNSLVKKGKILEAFVIESIAYGNVVKTMKTKVEANENEFAKVNKTQELNLKGISRYIKKLDDTDIKKFSKKFEVTEDCIKNSLNKLSPKKVIAAFESTKESLKSDYDLHSMLYSV